MVMQTKYPHIVRDNGDSEPYIKGTRITVCMVVSLVGRNPKLKDLERLVDLYPGYLTLEKVQAAIIYYKANKKEIDDYMAESKAMSGKIIRTGPPF